MKPCVIAIFFAFLAFGHALKCVPCNNKAAGRCTAIDASKCKYGITTDICDCCDVCAKGPGESCGGLWDMGGKCGKGIFCHPNRRDPQRPGKCSRRRL